MKKSILTISCIGLAIAIATSYGLYNTIQSYKTSGPQEKKYEREDDRKYEDKHKDSEWFRSMSEPNANYFKVMREYDKYFGSHQWETSKPRQLGAGWLRTNLFYLDKNGFVQDQPAFDPSKHQGMTPFKTMATTTSVGSWDMLGPSNSASTGYSDNFNKGGYAHLTRIDPTNASKIFVSFQTGGLWVTSDGGANWTLTDTNMPNNPYYDLDVCVAAPNTIYAISNEGVVKSVDGGLSYTLTQLNKSNYSGQAYDIAVSRVSADVVVARWSDKIYRTADGGATWTSIVTGLPNYTIWEGLHSEMLDWSTTNPAVVYFLSTSSNNMIDLYRSDDSGASFTNIRTITLDAAANGQVIGWGKLFLPSNNSNEIYVAVGSGANTYAHHSVHLYKVNNTTGADVAGFPRVNMVTGVGNDELHHGDMSMDRNDEDKIVFGTYSQFSIHYSTDNGATFTFPLAHQCHADFRSLDMVSGNVAIGNDGEVQYSTDSGVTYTNLTNAISNHELWGFGSSFKDDLIAAGLNHGPAMIKEAGNGFDWYNGSGADQENTDVNPLDNRYVYSRGYSNYRYFRTGVHTLINEANLLDLGSFHFFNNIEFHPNLYYTIITHHYGGYPSGNPNLATWKNSLVRTDDNGATLSIVKTFTDQVFREKICMTNPDIIYVVVGLSNNKLWKTTDGGVNWTDVTPTGAESNGQTNISDIAISGTDPDRVWVTYSGVQTACKILKSTNGGSSYTNETDAALMGSHPIARIVFQRGSGDGVYICNKDGVYFKNAGAWSKVGGNDLPMMDIRFMFINYNLGKLRIGTSRGAWEHDLAETSPPKAQISASTKIVNCPSTDEVQFKDYSTVRNSSATWAWTFAGGTPATSNLENPIVSYEGVADGNYTVSLTVTDAHGTDSQTLTDFIEVKGAVSGCGIDTIPGNVLNLSAAGDYAQASKGLGITTNTITMSCWVKPDGTQSNFTGVMATGNDGGTMINYYSNNTLGYTWRNEAGSYNFNSNLVIPENEWSHLALVVTPTSATLYLNGVGVTRTAAHAAVDFSGAFQFGIDRGNTSRNFKGAMDEIAIYDRSLTEAEIRELMHLTRNNPNAGSLPAVDASLVAYYQANAGAGKPLYDKVGGSHATLVGGATNTVVSTAPVGGGTFQRLDASSAGLKDFATPGLELTFPAAGTYPNGDLVVTRLNVPSDQPAAARTLPSSPSGYFIIRNFGTNSTFTNLDGIKFKKLGGTNDLMVATPSGIKLLKRESSAEGSTWGATIGDASTVTNNAGVGTTEFTAGLTLTSFSQFSVSVDANLPVELMSFTAKKKNEKEALLNWESAEEINFDRYEIERSTVATEYRKIGTVSGKGSGNYTFNDVNPSYGDNYYRLKMIDLDGTYKYSDVEIVNFRAKAQLTLRPNPSPNGEISFNIEGMENNSDISMIVTNTAGQLVKSLYLNDIENNAEYKTKITSTPGIYFVRITLDNGQVFVEKLIIGKE